MKKITFPILFLSGIVLLVIACRKMDTEFRDFFNGKETVYPGKPLRIDNRPGNNRVQLFWNPSPDPSITQYVVYWNNKRDSVVVTATSHNPADSVRALVTGLSEYTYSFTIVALDAAGNRSVPVDINNVQVFGSQYIASLLNRPFDKVNPYEVKPDGSVVLYFLMADSLNTGTRIEYTTTNGLLKDTILTPGANTITIPDRKTGTVLRYNSGYVPVRNALDTFYAARYDTFPAIYTYVPCDKSKFAAVSLPNDAYADFGTSINLLWDGSQGPQGYPNIFHSNAAGVPQHFTFDLGQVYPNLARVEETGRDCCHNPDQFEVWGINDLTNAATTLPAGDPGWAAESVAKGWTLLKAVTRNDDGSAPMRFDLMNNPPPVRYIRIRVIHVVTNQDYSNMSELTFWNKQ